MKKKRTAQSAFFNLRILITLLLCAVAACALLNRPLLAVLRFETSTNVSPRILTFAERVAYQRAIEDVYWRHRIWPKENPNPKPSLDAVRSKGQLEKKVTDYLRKSHALEDYWRRPITVEQLQAEMDRMAKHTKKPEVLRELFKSLGDDPFVIAECLARPLLAQRLFQSKLPASPKANEEPIQSGTHHNADVTSLISYTLPVIVTTSDPDGGCIDDTWTATTLMNAPDARYYHTAVWTGTEMIVWGGFDNAGNRLDTGGRYDPITDNWTPTTTSGAPEGRWFHKAVWTGSEMIVWGGENQNSATLNTGGRYNPSSDSWTATSIANAPDAREMHTAIWTGSEMIVWGGVSYLPHEIFNTGGKYNPSTDTWTATSTINTPTLRYSHTAVWTGSEMVVWGGYGGNALVNTGGRYNPGTDSWTATSTINAPAARYLHTVVWTGSEMIIWGGGWDVSVGNTGGRYNPSTDIWITTSIVNVPTGRTDHTAVWTGSEMIVWGGNDGSPDYSNTGGRYNPETDSWTATSTTDAPDGREDHSAIWTGSEMIVWGGGYFMVNTGGRYCAQSGAPSPTPTATPTPTGCAVTSPLCGLTVHIPPTDFQINLSAPVDPSSVQASDLTVNGIPADSAVIGNGNTTIDFIFNLSPAININTIHISAGAFDCGPPVDFNCTFFLELIPPPTPTATPTPRSTPTPRPRPSPRPRP